MLNKTTLVTSYLELNDSKHSKEHYNRWIANILQLNANFIIFTNVKDKFTEKNNIKIVETDFPDFFVNKYPWNDHLILDHEKKIHNVFLYQIWNEKSNFVKKAIELDFFNSDYFYWIDIGIIRDSKILQRYLNEPFPKKVTEKILLLNIEPFQNHEISNTIDSRFQRKDRIGGGIFGGNKENCLKWHSEYYKILDLFFKKNIFAGKDQSIMIFVYLNNKELIELVKPQKYPNGDPWFYLLEYLNTPL